MRRTLYLLAFSALALGVGWVYRSPIARFLTPPEADYTPDWKLGSEYGRPNADLTPVWRVELEPGYAGAAIDRDEVFLLDREVGVADTLRVFDLETGDERWTFTYPEPGRLQFAGSRTTPAVVDNLVYLCSSFGQVHCVDRETHELVWRRHLIEDVGGELPDFGWAATPLVRGDLVILPALGPDVGLAAFERFTGELVWRTTGVGFSHSTPVVLELLGEPQLVFLSAAEQGQGKDAPAPTTVSAFEPETGDLLWQIRPMLTSVPVPPAVRVDDEHFFLTGGYLSGSTLMRIARDGGTYSFDEVFHIDKGAQLHPPVVHEGHIYLLANENRTDSLRRRDEGGLSCFDLEGNELWTTEDDPYLGRGHMMLVGQHILIQDGLSGFLRLCRASPDGYQQVVTANVFRSPPKERRRMWAPMAASQATFVVRGESELLCVLLGGRPVGPGPR